MPISLPYTQYGGIWKLNSASAAKGAGTWPVPPDPYLFSWGNNGTGILGLGNTTNYSSPKQVGSLTNWVFGALGGGMASSVKSDSTLWTWGENTHGQL